MKRFLFAPLLAAAILIAQQQPAKPKSALDKAVFEAYVRHLQLYVPGVTVTVSDPKPAPIPGFQEVTVRASMGQASEERVYYISRDGKKIVQGAVYDIDTNPFKADLDRLQPDGYPSMGTPGAPVVIVLYSDFQCAYCKEEAAMLRTNLLKAYPTEVRLYFKDYPLSQIHPWAKAASITGRCLHKQSLDSFWQYHDWLFENQATITPENFKEKVNEQAKKQNWNSIQLEACIATPAPANEVEKSIAEGKLLGVNSTPTMFINGRKIAYAIPWENLKQVIDFEVGYQKTAQNAGEACCTVALPSLVSPPKPK